MKKIDFLPVGGATLTLLLLLGAGCHSASSEQHDLMFDDLTAGERPVAMRGEAVFLDGKLAATAMVSRGFGTGMKDTGHTGRYKGKERDKDTLSEAGNVSGYSTSVSSDDSEEAQQAAMDDYIRMVRAQRAAGSPMPPVTLRVQFQNRGTEPLTVAVTDVNSDLGNFAVRPDKLILAPGESGTLEPMISQLGVSSDDIPIKVTLRVGAKKETQIVTVKTIKSLLTQPTPKK